VEVEFTIFQTAVSTMVTSNRPVEDWGKLLGDSAAVTAMLDRLLHHGHILKCGPRSWRTKLQAEQNGGKATTQTTTAFEEIRLPASKAIFFRLSTTNSSL
jgi:hypothetical protein